MEKYVFSSIHFNLFFRHLKINILQKRCSNGLTKAKNTKTLKLDIVIPNVRYVSSYFSWSDERNDQQNRQILVAF